MKPLPKSFSISDDGFWLRFPNGWSMNVLIGTGHYSDNKSWATNRVVREQNSGVLISDTCECTVHDSIGNDRTWEIAEKLNLSCDGGSDMLSNLTYTTIAEWLQVFDYVREKEPVEQTRPQDGAKTVYLKYNENSGYVFLLDDYIKKVDGRGICFALKIPHYRKPSAIIIDPFGVGKLFFDDGMFGEFIQVRSLQITGEPDINFR